MIRKFFASIFVLIFVSLAAPLVFSWQIYESFTDPKFYTEDFYEAAHAVFIDEAENIIKDKKISFLNDDAPIHDLLITAVKEENFKKMLIDVVDQLWNTDLYGGKVVNLQVDFPSLLNGNDKFYDSLFVYLKGNLPVCPGDIDVEPLSCLDQDFVDDDFKAQVKSVLDRELFANLPNEYAIGLPMEVETTVAEFAEKGSGIIGSFYLSVVIFVLFLTALIIYRPWERVLSWIFGTLFFTAIHLIVLTTAVLYLANALDAVNALFIDMTFGVVARTLLYYYAIPTSIISLFVWIFTFLRFKR